MIHYLGLDYGEKHVGVAVATTFVAEAVEVVVIDKAVSRIGELIDQYKISEIVLGLSENEMGEKIKAFANLLEEKFHLPIHFCDETLSSQETRKSMAIKGVKRSVREAKIDHFVAARILQDFLDEKLK